MGTGAAAAAAASSAAAMFCFLDWGEQEDASVVGLPDYQEAHSTAFDGLVWDNWHHYTDCTSISRLTGNAHTRAGTADGHSVKK